MFRARTDERTPEQSTFSFELHSAKNRSELAMPASYADDIDPIQHLLITTKAYDAIEALASVAHRLDENSHVLLMVNGMGLIEALEEEFPLLRFYVGTTTEGAYRRSRQEFVHAGTGVTKIGREENAVPVDWFADFARLSISCLWEAEIHQALWQKLAVNCAINPLTALNGCLNGDLENREYLVEKLRTLCDEIATVADAVGQEELAASLHTQVSRVVSDTAENRSSMLQDIEANRRTEIDYISGYLIDRAVQLNIPVPENKQLANEIHKLEFQGPTGKDRE